MSTTYTATRYAGDTNVATTTGAIGDASTDASIAPGAARALTVTVDFGVSSGRTVTTVTGVPWVKATPRPQCEVVGRPSAVAFADDEDALTEAVRAIVTNVVDGVSFDVVAYAPNNSSGVFTISIIGVGT